jgi:hypothetical protein
MMGGVRNHTPLILVKESGRAVDCVQEYYFKGTHDEELLTSMFKKCDGSPDEVKIAKAKQQVEDIVENGQLYFYDVTGESGTGGGAGAGMDGAEGADTIGGEGGHSGSVVGAAEGEGFGGDETSSNLLHLITLSLVENDHLSHNVKMCMLVRWNSSGAVKALLATKPIEEDSLEPQLDEELLVYSAFHDHGVREKRKRKRKKEKERWAGGGVGKSGRV